MFSNNSFLCFCASIMDSMHNDKELFLTQNSFSEEILQQDFSIDSTLDGLDSDEIVMSLLHEIYVQKN